jgi:hypothetical protein
MAIVFFALAAGLIGGGWTLQQIGKRRAEAEDVAAASNARGNAIRKLFERVALSPDGLVVGMFDLRTSSCRAWAPAAVWCGRTLPRAR